MKESPKKIVPVADLNLLAFLDTHGIPFEIKTKDNYGFGLVEANDQFYDLSLRFNNDEVVAIKSFTASLRRVRARILAAKEEARRKERANQ